MDCLCHGGSAPDALRFKTGVKTDMKKYYFIFFPTNSYIDCKKKRDIKTVRQGVFTYVLQSHICTLRYINSVKNLKQFH